MTYIAPATKVLRYPETLAAMQRGDRVWPMHVEMDLSGTCNLACGWCRFGDGRQGGGMMDDAFAADILEQLRDGGTKAVTFSGGGEPTVNPRFADVARFAHQVGLKVGVYTNGVNRERLIAAAPWCEWIYVSLDAADAESYKRAKGCDQFDQVCGTIVALAWCTRTLGVGFLLTGENCLHIRAMKSLAMELGADYAQFRPVAGLDSYAWISGVPQLLERIDATYSEARFRELVAAWRGTYERGYTICRASELGPCIGSDGTVWVCPNTRGIKGRGLGNLHDESFVAIWERRETQYVGGDCEPTCRHHAMNKTLELVCAAQPHEEFV